MVAIGGCNLVGYRKLFMHVKECTCGRTTISPGPRVIRDVCDVEKLYAANDMGLTLEEFAVKLGYATQVVGRVPRATQIIDQ